MGIVVTLNIALVLDRARQLGIESRLAASGCLVMVGRTHAESLRDSNGRRTSRSITTPPIPIVPYSILAGPGAQCSASRLASSSCLWECCFAVSGASPYRAGWAGRRPIGILKPRRNKRLKLTLPSCGGGLLFVKSFIQLLSLGAIR